MMSFFITTGMILSQSLFAKAFGGADSDYGYSVAQTSDGGYVVAGYTYSFGAGHYDFLVLKLDANGDLIWARTFGGTDSEFGNSVAQTSDGGYVVAGYTYSFGAGSNDVLVLKLDANGDLSWARTFGGTDSEFGYSVAQTSDGGCVVAGYTDGFGVSHYDFLVLKLDASGDLSWAKTFGGTDTDYGNSVAQTADGGCVVMGETGSFGAGYYDILMLKLDVNGDLSWARTFGGVGYDYVNSVAQSSDGGYIVAGETGSFGAGYYDVLMLKLDVNGDISWAKTFGGADYDYGNSVAQTADGGCVVAGETDNFGAGGEELLVLKLDASGDYTNCVEACTLVVDTPNLMVSSASGNESCIPDQASPNPTVNSPALQIDTICTTVAVSELGHSVIKEITCSPFAGGVLFIAPGAIDLRIYSVDGRLVQGLRLNRGENRVTLNRGVYLWRAGGYTGKAVVR